MPPCHTVRDKAVLGGDQYWYLSPDDVTKTQDLSRSLKVEGMEGLYQGIIFVLGTWLFPPTF